MASAATRIRQAIAELNLAGAECGIAQLVAALRAIER